MAGGMRFNRGWDFNPGNKQLDLNSLTQDAEVVAVLQDAIVGAGVTGTDVAFDPTGTGLAATDVQEALVELDDDIDSRITTALDALIAGAPGALDTLNELAAALGDDANFAATVSAALATKLDTEGVMDYLGTTGLVEGAGVDLTYDDGAGTVTIAQKASGQPEVLMFAVTDETTAIAAGAGQLTFRMPFAMTLTGVRANLKTASSAAGPFTVDINEAGATILSTKLTIDDGEKTSTTAATAAVISDAALADDAEITIDVDDEGTGATGLKVYFIGTRT